LQHIDNNHPKAVANDPQFPPGRVHTSEAKR
jgi:hypothetical protein